MNTLVCFLTDRNKIDQEAVKSPFSRILVTNEYNVGKNNKI